MAPRALLIPSLLDDWFPLLQYAFASKRWTPVLLTEDRGLADLGLQYIHSDMCYPAHLVAGQVLSALRSGKYDPSTCGVLIGQAGDECRGSCFVRILRRQLALAGYPQVTLLTLNIREIDKQDRLPIRPAMIHQALAGAVWGDALAILRDQTRPFEAVPGAAEALWTSWLERLGEELRQGRKLSRRHLMDRCREMAQDFRRLERVERPVQKIALVGEIYTKYCRLGNWDLRKYLAREHCQVGTGGITWYALYLSLIHI